MITKKIISIASNTNNYGLTNEYTHKSSIKNTKCGDKIKIEITMKNKRITSLRYETKSCIFCEASASMLSNRLNLIKVNSLSSDVDLIKKFFNNDVSKLPSKFKPFKDILNKKNFKRFDCIILPFMGIMKALDL